MADKPAQEYKIDYFGSFADAMRQPSRSPSTPPAGTEDLLLHVLLQGGGRLDEKDLLFRAKVSVSGLVNGLATLEKFGLVERSGSAVVLTSEGRGIAETSSPAA